MSNEFIDEIIEAQERTAKNIELLADEIDVSESKLETGASPEERKAERQKAALFGGGTVEKGAPDESPGETAAALMEQNQANIATVAKAAGVSSHKLADGSSAADGEFMAALGGGAKAKSADSEPAETDAEEQLKGMDPDEQLAALFGNPGPSDRSVGEEWQRAIQSEDGA